MPLRRPRLRPLLLSLVLLALTGAVAAQGAAPLSDTIRLEDLRADLFFLAGDGFRGLLVGTPENALAADWVRSRFERAGHRPGAPDGTFVQPTQLMVATLGEGNALHLHRSETDGQTFRPMYDFYPQRFSANASTTARVAYAGFGITARALTYDDYGDRVRGRIALILDHEPGERDPKSPFDGLVSSEPAVAIRKALAAQAAGAVGVLLVTDVHNHPAPQAFDAAARAFWPPTPPRIDRFTLASWADQVRIPVAQVSPAVAESLIGPSGRSLVELSRAAETASGFAPLWIDGPTVTLTTRVNRHTVADRNVLALLEGSDPALSREVVIVSAHYDHEGAEGSTVFNGADDNASGTVALVNIADAFARAAAAGQRPRRSVMFAAWGSEERGPLLGAWAYTEAPTIPLAQTVAVLNMDMIGHDEEVEVGGGARFAGLDVQTAESNRNAVNLLGYSRHPQLSGLVERLNASGARLDLRLRYDNNSSNLLRRSDQWPFLQRGVPALWFHTGLHPDYHTAYDRPEKINYRKMTAIARLVHQAAWTLATQDARPR